MEIDGTNECCACGDSRNSMRKLASDQALILQSVLLPHRDIEQLRWCDACRVQSSKLLAARSGRLRNFENSQKNPGAVLEAAEKIFKRRRLSVQKKRSASVNIEREHMKGENSTRKCTLCLLNKENSPGSIDLDVDRSATKVTVTKQGAPSPMTESKNLISNSVSTETTYYALLLALRTVQSSFHEASDDFYDELIRRRRKLGEQLSKDVLQSIMRSEDYANGWICSSHYQAMKKVQLEIDSVCCALCSRKFRFNCRGVFHLPMMTII